MSTLFSAVYNRFLGSVTDDLYVELTPEDTLKDLQNLLIQAMPKFEFPHVNLVDYSIDLAYIPETDIDPNDFVIGVVWDDIEQGEPEIPTVLVDRSCFKDELTSEEINILATIMRIGWLQRQITSIENTRMKYSGPDFKMTSQANHLAKLIAAKNDSMKELTHAQRLYNRRRLNKETGHYESNWDIFGSNNVI